MQNQLNNIYNALMGANAQGLQQIGTLPFLLLLAVSLVASLFIAYLYLHFYSNRATGSQVHRAFPLLGISVTAIFVCIQFSLPLSLGLLGALSIVRFRTPIKEPEEIGFIMLVIAVSIATATFKLPFVGVIFVVAVIGLVIQTGVRLFRSSTLDGVIVVTLPTDGQPANAEAIAELLKKRLSRARLESVSRSEHETVMSYNFQGISEGSLLALQSELSAAARSSSFNIFFNRS